jgi:hypothetical protein
MDIFSCYPVWNLSATFSYILYMNVWIIICVRYSAFAQTNQVDRPLLAVRPGLLNTLSAVAHFKLYVQYY